MQHYTVVVPNHKSGAYRLTSLIIGLMNLALFSSFWIQKPSDTIKWILLAGILFLCAAILHYFFLQKKNKTSVYLNFCFIFCGFIWLLLDIYFTGIGLLIFGIFGIYANKPFKLVFKEDGIWYPSFPAKIIPWENIDQVLLKDRILTIDLINNKLLQFTIPASFALPDESHFNQFCRSCTLSKKST
jgi:hypothetical protein